MLITIQSPESGDATTSTLPPGTDEDIEVLAVPEPATMSSPEEAVKATE